MSVEILLPKLGFSMEEGKLVSWLAQDGAHVTEGTPLFEMEGDKAIQEVEAPASGTLRILAAPDQTYPVGAVLGRVE